MNTTFARIMIVIKVFGQMLFLFGLLAWLDGVIVQFTHPEWLPIQVSHLLPWVRTDTFTISMFIVSAVGFFVWKLIADLMKIEKNKATPS
jgi:hypothetical protein